MQQPEGTLCSLRCRLLRTQLLSLGQGEGNHGGSHHHQAAVPLLLPAARLALADALVCRAARGSRCICRLLVSCLPTMPPPFPPELPTRKTNTELHSSSSSTKQPGTPAAAQWTAQQGAAPTPSSRAPRPLFFYKKRKTQNVPEMCTATSRMPPLGG